VRTEKAGKIPQKHPSKDLTFFTTSVIQTGGSELRHEMMSVINSLLDL
jgi:hypothetical protein